LWHFDGTKRQFAWHIGTRGVLHEALDNAVFERLKADHREAPAAR
jgi:hypothetical protein